MPSESFIYCSMVWIPLLKRSKNLTMLSFYKRLGLKYIKFSMDQEVLTGMAFRRVLESWVFRKQHFFFFLFLELLFPKKGSKCCFQLNVKFHTRENPTRITRHMSVIMWYPSSNTLLFQLVSISISLALYSLFYIFTILLCNLLSVVSIAHSPTEIISKVDAIRIKLTSCGTKYEMYWNKWRKYWSLAQK